MGIENASVTVLQIVEVKKCSIEIREMKQKYVNLNMKLEVIFRINRLFDLAHRALLKNSKN
jgi:hypothetical protein